MNDAEERLSRELTEGLRTALANAAADARRKHPGEHFYAYILYTLPLFDYAVLLFNTEEGLIRIAGDHSQQVGLRWLPSEWECSKEFEKPFERVNEILGLLAQLQGYEDAECDKRRRVLMDVLKFLDAQGVFGTGPARETALVNIMWGDQDDCAHIESARELNHTASYVEYARYVLPSLHAAAKETGCGRSRCKEEAMARICRIVAQVESDLAKVRSR